MKNGLFKLILVSMVLLFTACGSKVPFIEKEVSKENALVYIYVSKDIGDQEFTTDSSYKIRINEKSYKQQVKMGEYLPFEMKVNKTKFSIVRAALEEKVLSLNLKASQTYYLRVNTNLEDNEFSFTKISNDVGSKEIMKMGLAGSTAVDIDSIITEMVGSVVKNEEKVLPTKSKIDEINDAHKLKQDGLITEDEYKKLKTDILAK